MVTMRSVFVRRRDGESNGYRGIICAQRCAVSFELALAHFNFQHPASATCCDGRLIALTAIKRPFSDQGTIVPSAAKLFHGLDAGTAAGGVESLVRRRSA